MYKKLLTALAVITAVLFIVWLWLNVSEGRFSGGNEENGVSGVRTNTECTTEERVFDYADVLTDSEEGKLRQLIAEQEKKTACDIVLVTLNETLEYYQPAGSVPVTMNDPEDWIRAYADDFWDTHYFGYNTGTEGDGVILVDDWYREPADGRIHTWLSTSGRAYAALGDREISRILDDVYEDIEENPYEAYGAYVKSFARIINADTEYSSGPVLVIGWFTFLPPILLALVLLAYYYRNRKGRVEVNKNTYVQQKPAGYGVQILQNSDRFLHKHVTRERIQRDDHSGGGGGGGFGGGHISSGGASHGGGGHSR